MDLQKVSKDLIAYAWNIPRVIVFAVFLAIAFIFISENGRQAKDKLLALLKKGWLAAYLFYLAFILVGTVFARQHTIPYKRIFENFGFRDDLIWNLEIVENIILFIPYTFLYMQAFKPKGRIKSALTVTAATSGLIELCQLIFWVGSFQFADIFHNVLGGMIGYFIWWTIDKRTVTSAARWLASKIKGSKGTGKPL